MCEHILFYSHDLQTRRSFGRMYKKGLFSNVLGDLWSVDIHSRLMYGTFDNDWLADILTPLAKNYVNVVGFVNQQALFDYNATDATLWRVKVQQH